MNDLNAAKNAILANLNKLAFSPMPPDMPQGAPGGGAPGQLQQDPQTGMLVDPASGQMFDPQTGQPVQGGAPGGAPPPPQGAGAPAGMDPNAGMPPPGMDPSQLMPMISQAVAEGFQQAMGQQQQVQQGMQELSQRLDQLEVGMGNLLQTMGVGQPSGLSPETDEVLNKLGSARPREKEDLIKAAQGLIDYVRNGRDRLQSYRQKLDQQNAVRNK